MPPLDQDSWKKLGFPPESWDTLIEEIEERYQDARSVLLSGMEAQAREPAGLRKAS